MAGVMANPVKEEENMAAAAVDTPPPALPAGAGVPVAEGGGALSPLSGAYLLIILSEPMSDQHKSKMVQKLRQGKCSPKTTLY